MSEERHVLVTGAGGRIGSAVTEHLVGAGVRVTAMDRNFRTEPTAYRVVRGNTTAEADVADALEDVTEVVHLAALPHQSAGTPYEVYSTNVVSTFNVLAQAGQRAIRRAVIASSIQATGLPGNHHDITPAYFPIDENIPVDLDDWYSLSKYSDEQTAGMASRRWGISVIALRFPLVTDFQTLRRRSDVLREDPGSVRNEGWTYLDVRDAARAVGLALQAPGDGARVVFLAADTTLMPYPTEELIAAFAPNSARLRRFVGREAPIDLTRARTLLGFKAEHELDIETIPLPRNE
ncbi:MAG TPA: NAD(P)-dependent oxidoreductase [Mycobacteriales bacterium]|nr:NAD(P)-dependent oxidoreductase [Mycobacteriales bacterium]